MLIKFALHFTILDIKVLDCTAQLKRLLIINDKPWRNVLKSLFINILCGFYIINKQWLSSC